MFKQATGADGEGRAWYSLNDDNLEATDTHSNLFKPNTKQITVVG
ncbi:MAG: hypothetical protein ACETWR_09760 [Anaerolineae bacterium]